VLSLEQQVLDGRGIGFLAGVAHEEPSVDDRERWKSRPNAWIARNVAREMLKSTTRLLRSAFFLSRALEAPSGDEDDVVLVFLLGEIEVVIAGAAFRPARPGFHQRPRRFSARS